jgi:hypothetical protein
MIDYNFIKENKINDFIIKINDEIILIDDYIFESQNAYNIVRQDDNSFLRVINDEYLKTHNPDVVNINEYWKNLYNIFPHGTITSNPNVKNIEEAKNVILNLFFKHFNFHEILNEEYTKNINLKMLEIGAGYGNLKDFLQKNYNINNYYAIDTCKMFEYDKLFLTDGKNIPSEIPNPLDLIVSLNVFQHLSTAQKISYFKQIELILTENGKFIFSQFFINNDIKNLKIGDNYIFGFRDNEDNCYLKFYDQFTLIDNISNLMKIVENLNLKISLIGNKLHYGLFLVEKKNN